MNNNWLFWLLICFVIISVILSLLLIILTNNYKKIFKHNPIDKIKYLSINKETKKLKCIREKYKKQLRKIKIDPDISQHSKQIIHDELVEYRNQQLLLIEEDIQKNKLDYLKKIILETMQPLHLKIINESSVYYIPIDDKIKPLMIGKKGRSIKQLSEISGCNINVNRNDPFIEISCPNPFDRAIAINVVKHMIKSEAFDINAIKNIYNKEKQLILSDCITCGKKYLSMLNISCENSKLCDYVGRLKYRWSYSQNVLEHCYETALICEKLAQEFGLDAQLAKEMGFFHDIGKAIDYEQSFDHVKTGIEIAKQCNLKQVIIDTIANHHRTTCNEDYVLLVKCADAWSAARVGARHMENNEQQLMQILKSKLNLISDIAKYKIDINDKNITIFFIPKINTLEKQKIVKYQILKNFKKDARLKKYSIFILGY